MFLTLYFCIDGRFSCCELLWEGWALGKFWSRLLTITVTSPSPYAGDEGKSLLKTLTPCSSRTSSKFGGCEIASTEKCPELSGYFYSVQNLLLFYGISKVPFLPYWRVEIQKRCFCSQEECFALGIESKGATTCVPFSPHQSVVYCHGGRIGFFQGDIRLLSDDMKALKPTIFPVVPRLLNRMYDKVSWILILLFLEQWMSLYVPLLLVGEFP